MIECCEIEMSRQRQRNQAEVNQFVLSKLLFVLATESYVNKYEMLNMLYGHDAMKIMYVSQKFLC